MNQKAIVIAIAIAVTMVVAFNFKKTPPKPVSVIPPIADNKNINRTDKHYPTLSTSSTSSLSTSTIIGSSGYVGTITGANVFMYNCFDTNTGKACTINGH